MVVKKEHKKIIMQRLLEEVQYLRKMDNQKDQSDLWSSRMGPSLKKFLKEDGTIYEKRIDNFRGIQIFISELPSFQYLFPLHFMSGKHRGQRCYGKERLDVMKKEGDIEYLRKYPIDLVGNPDYFKIDGFYFNERWSRHVRYIHLASMYLKEFLLSKMPKVLDIGGGYGIFSVLLKREFGHVISGIVEFPEQLLLAYYYLAMSFPEARINSLQEINEVKVIDNIFIEKYDFLLIPIHCYSKIQKNTFNMITNFNSLGEMSEKWFNHYLDADVFKSAVYFFTLNRFESRPTYKTNLNILDYRLHEYDKLHFQISPLFPRYYIGKYLFFKKPEYFTSQFFEFIGKRKN